MTSYLVVKNPMLPESPLHDFLFHATLCRDHLIFPSITMKDLDWTIVSEADYCEAHVKIAPMPLLSCKDGMIALWSSIRGELHLTPEDVLHHALKIIPDPAPASVVYTGTKAPYTIVPRERVPGPIIGGGDDIWQGDEMGIQVTHRPTYDSVFARACMLRVKKLTEEFCEDDTFRWIHGLAYDTKRRVLHVLIAHQTDVTVKEYMESSSKRVYNDWLTEAEEMASKLGRLF